MGNTCAYRVVFHGRIQEILKPSRDVNKVLHKPTVKSEYIVQCKDVQRPVEWFDAHLPETPQNLEQARKAAAFLRDWNPNVRIIHRETKETVVK